LRGRRVVTGEADISKVGSGLEARAHWIESRGRIRPTMGPRLTLQGWKTKGKVNLVMRKGYKNGKRS